MATRTLLGSVANVVNAGLSAMGFALTRLPERHSMERQVQKLLRDHRVDCVIDVGAHYGEFAESLRHEGYKGRIISFEPSEDAFRRTSLKTEKDSLWEVHHMCLGSSDGTVEIQRFKVTEFNSLHTPTKYAEASCFKEHMQPEGVESVPMRRLDSFLPEIGVDPSKLNVYLKVDTQGHDIEVLRGASGVIKDIDVLQTEVCSMRLYQDVPTMSESLALFREFGYLPEGFYAVPNPKNPTPVLEWDCILTRVDEASLASA